MKTILVTLLLSITFLVGNTSASSKLKHPIGSYSQALGGINILSDAHSTFHNPALRVQNKRVAISGSLLENKTKDGMISFSTRIKKKLGFNATYLYSNISGIPIYSNDEILVKYSYDASHFMTFGLNYLVLSSKSKGSFSVGASLNVAKEYATIENTTEGPIDGINIGLNYSIKDLELSASMKNIFGVKKWAYTQSNEEETQKEIDSYDIPLNTSIAGKYSFLNVVSVLTQLDIESNAYNKTDFLGRVGLLFNLGFGDISTGYGDERFSIGFGKKLNLSKTKTLDLHGAISSRKLDGINTGLSIALEF